MAAHRYDGHTVYGQNTQTFDRPPCYPLYETPTAIAAPQRLQFRAVPADLSDMTDLERSHAELRAALIIAGLRIRKLNFGRRDDRAPNAPRAGRG